MDVRLYQTDDDGDIQYVNGKAVMSDGLETAAYLSLFGGNARDSGGDDTLHLQWWGNLSENDPSRQYRSETQHLIEGLSASTSNLRRVEDAANRDLAWMVESGLATSAEATATIPALNRLRIAVVIVIDDETFDFVFTATWRLLNQ